MPETNLTNRFLNCIAEALEANCKWIDTDLSGLSIAIISLSELRLRMSAITPFIVVTANDIKRLGQTRIADLVRQELIERQDRPGSVVILVESDGVFLEFAGGDPYWAAVIPEAAMLRIMEHTNTRRSLLETLRATVPLRFLSPYEPNQAVCGSQFFGRKDELNLFRAHPKRSFAVKGGRRIGKTSLLKEYRRILVEKDIPADQVQRVVRFDFWGYNGEAAFFDDVVRHFGEGFPKLVRPDFASYFPRYIKRMRGLHGGPIIFLLDEVDDLIKEERRTGYRLLGILKRIAQAGDCRLLIAGFRHLSEELGRHDTPLSFLQPISLHNLRLEQARAMVVEPMESMGVRLDREVFPQILNDTGGHPQLIQLYCQTLVEALDTVQERLVTTRLLHQIKVGGRLYDTLVDILVDNTTDLEFALVHSLADHEQFGSEEIDTLLSTHGIQISYRGIHRICRNLENIGIVTRKGSADTYQFVIPVQAALARQLAGTEFVWRKAQQQLDLSGIGA